MAEFVYTTVPGKIKTLLNKIREVGVPTKVSVQWLKSVGFKSSNDASLIGILKFIGFIDSGGIPTSRWSQYRGANHASVLGEAIREGYAELFAVYPDANQRSQSDIEHVVVSIILCKILRLPAGPRLAGFFALSQAGLTSNAIPS